MRDEAVIIRDIVKQMIPSPRFFVGNWDDIVSDNSLIAWDKSKVKYPLIFMHSDYPSEHGSEMNYTWKFTTDFYFVTDTIKGYSTEKRIEEIYEKKLYPLFENFSYALFRSGKIVFDENIYNWRKIANEKKNMYYKPNILNDIVDILRINLTLKIR